MQEASKSNSFDSPEPSLERLCELAANDENPDKLIKLLQKINELVEENTKRSAKTAGQKS
jgi:hypothetical protein